MRDLDRRERQALDHYLTTDPRDGAVGVWGDEDPCRRTDGCVLAHDHTRPCLVPPAECQVCGWVDAHEEGCRYHQVVLLVVEHDLGVDDIDEVVFLAEVAATLDDGCLVSCDGCDRRLDADVLDLAGLTPSTAYDACGDPDVTICGACVAENNRALWADIDLDSLVVTDDQVRRDEWEVEG